MQLLDLAVQNQGDLESHALVPCSSLVPTQLPAPNQLDLSLGLGLELGGSGGEADLQANWVAEETAMDLDFSTRPFDVQSLSTASSSGGGSGSQRAEKKPKKKEESGSCDECHRSFSRRSDVRRHKNTHIRDEDKELHPCPKCHKLCSRKDALLRHIRDQH